MNKKQKTIFILLIVVLLALCITSIGAKADENYPIKYRVTASSLNVRFAPGTEYDVFYKLTYGEEVYGKESEGSWVEINCYGFKGYVWSNYIRNADAPTYTEPNYSGNMYYYGRCYITGYDTCARCCGKSDGITASGRRATVGRTVAMAGVPYGTQIYIKGIGYRVVEDRGVGSGKVDVLCSNHSECYAITGYYDVYIVK